MADDDIIDGFATTFRDFVTDGVPSSGKNKVKKSEARGLGQIVSRSVQAAAAGNMDAETWAVLAANPGTRNLQPGTVPPTDVGTHTDPVAGGTVPNSGSYRWSVSPAGWRRIGEFVDASTAMNAVDALEADLAVIDQDVSSLSSIVQGPAVPAFTTESGLILKSNGTNSANSGYRRTDFIDVGENTEIHREAATSIGVGSTTAPIIFYDASGTFLGFYSSGLTSDTITISEVQPGARKIRVVYVSTDTLVLTLQTKALANAVSGLADLIGQTRDVALSDFFKGPLTSGYLVPADGSYVGSTAWVTTDYIPAVSGQTLFLTGAGNTSVSSISLWDANGLFLGSLGSFGTSTNRRIVIPNNSAIAYIRASATVASSPKLIGARLSDATFFAAMAPERAYALEGEALYLYGRGILADRSVSIAWGVENATEEYCEIIPADDDDIPVTLRARRGQAAKDVATFSIKVTPTPPVNPSNYRNIICLGDSLVYGINGSSPGIGTWPNELSRRLTGTGAAALSGAQSPAPRALNHFRFRGTIGSGPVKHEGRPGWSAAGYLIYSSISGTVNAFWDGSKFNMQYYLATNGFDLAGDPTGGVDATGSNLTVIVALGWNSVYTLTPATAARDMANLINAIRLTHPDCDIIIPGLNPAPKENHKAWDDARPRYVSELEIFNLAVRQFGSAYRGMAATKTNTEFLQLSHVFDPSYAYPTATFNKGLRTSGTVEYPIDHVHPNDAGYAQYADMLYYALLYKYCR